MMEFDQSAEILLFRSIDHPKGERNKDFGGKATDVSAKLHSGAGDGGNGHDGGQARQSLVSDDHVYRSRTG